MPTATAIKHPTSSILNKGETLFESGMEQDLPTHRDPFAPKTFLNLSPEILVEWIASIENKTCLFAMSVQRTWE